ncbi:hypothetical protein PRUB_a4081 [Pseudoalteromonas rubra]|uniref:Uncharacterized protein n=1 Tax=Pseudoalteromonas rubra TaxID=43658 RepID=A0A8T0CAV7_9GAMM|nr:hypothetical protein [Pseudoalteromonas rubra]KAF7787202.1 hypothetical protein PRUB_a4081 [Pseudoalteromonas rubra]
MLRTDLKIFLPERLGNEPNAGGHRTNTPLTNGKLNEVFTSISDVDYARSAFELVKLYPAVATGDDSRLQDARIFLSDQPTDPLLTTLLVQSSQLQDTSLLSGMMDMLAAAKFHGLASATSAITAESQEIKVDRVHANLAPTTSRRIDHTGVKPPVETSGYKIVRQQSYGRLYNISIDVPDLVSGRPYFYGTYQKYDYDLRKYITATLTQDQFVINGTTITNKTILSSPIKYGEFFNLHYLPAEFYRFHDFVLDGSTLTLGPGERVEPKTVWIKIPDSYGTIIDNGKGELIISGRLVATIDYDTGVLNAMEPIEFDAAGRNLGAIIRTKPITIRTLQFALDQSAIPETLYIRCKSTQGTDLSASCDAQGVITGEGITGSLGATSLVTLSFNVDVLPDSVSYDYADLIYEPVPTPPGGIDRSKLPGNGIVPIFHANNLVSIQSRERTSHPNLSNGQVINAIVDADWVDILDGNGASLYSADDSNYSYDRQNGTVTIKPGITVFSPPYIITTIQSELAMVADIDATTLQTLIPIKRTYPAGSTISSVYMLEDLQAKSVDERTLAAWQNNYEDSGTPASNSINTTQYPVELTNIGCISQRWAIVFTSDGYDVIGEYVGKIYSGVTAEDCAPINPFTASPYFILRKEAIGNGLNPGEAFLFTTQSAARPVMTTRSVSPGHSNIEQDSSTIAFWGSV